MSNWNKIFKPIVVLCVICIVMTGALAATNSVTAPIIEAATIAAQNKAQNGVFIDQTIGQDIHLAVVTHLSSPAFKGIRA